MDSHFPLPIELLGKVFEHLKLQESLPFRLVCKSWRAVINDRISEEKKVRLFCTTNSRDLEYYKSFKMRSIWISFSNEFQDPRPGFSNILKALEECGERVRELEYPNPEFLDNNRNVHWLHKVLSLTPNLEVLKLSAKISVPHFLELLQLTHLPKLRSLPLQKGFLDFIQDNEELAAKVLNKFPNLETNFRDQNLDSGLLQLLRSERRQHKVDTWIGGFFDNHGPVLEQLLFYDYPLTKLRFDYLLKCDASLAVLLSKILERFALSLKAITIIFNSTISCKEKDKPVINIPPLPLLGEMRLGTSVLEGGGPSITWNFGNNIAKSFPLLEYFHLMLKDTNNLTGPLGPSCEIWEPFVPFPGESTKIKSLKFLKCVDLSIPQGWIGPEENREWGKRFLQTYLMLYGYAGQSVVQDFIDWLK